MIIPRLFKSSGRQSPEANETKSADPGAVTSQSADSASPTVRPGSRLANVRKSITSSLSGIGARQTATKPSVSLQGKFRVPEAKPDEAAQSMPGHALHDAVRNNDVPLARRLIAEGLRPNTLNADRQSPLDLLDSIRTLPPLEIKQMRGALLASQNPTAPAGYVKPETIHGSPWGLEILLTGELRGGVNDAKGGSQSKEGHVFFSDRTPKLGSEETTRSNLRAQARSYGKGGVIRNTAPDNVGLQYRTVQALRRVIQSGEPLRTTAKPMTIMAETSEEAHAGLMEKMKDLMAKSPMLAPGTDVRDLPLQKAADLISLPEEILLETRSGKVLAKYEGDDLQAFYRQYIADRGREIEDGKAPFLALINSGRVVPVVFGFEKISGLKIHTIYADDNNTIPKASYSYQSENHPLEGSGRGGKLKEIELKTVADLTTLTLGILAKGAEIPADVVIRLNPSNKRAKAESKQAHPDAPEKWIRAEYLTSDQMGAFRANLTSDIARLENIDLERVGKHVQGASIESLQFLNERLRELAESDPAARIPARQEHKQPF